MKYNICIYIYDLLYELVVNMGKYLHKREKSAKISRALRHSLFSRTFPFFTALVIFADLSLFYGTRYFRGPFPFLRHSLFSQTFPFFTALVIFADLSLFYGTRYFRGPFPFLRHSLFSRTFPFFGKYFPILTTS